jgi:hypothetical protein
MVPLRSNAWRRDAGADAGETDDGNAATGDELTRPF